MTGDGVFLFHDPWLLLLAPILIALTWWGATRRWGRAAARFSSLAGAMRLPASARRVLRHAPLVLRLLALALLVLAFARPQFGREEVRRSTEGVAIEVVIDRSSSMGEEIEYGGKTMTRLDAVRKVFRDFVIGDEKDLKGRPDDLIGLIVFARFADTVCPLIQSRGVLSEFLSTVKLVTRRPEDGTALGDALSLAAARLHTVADDLRRRDPKLAQSYKIKSKVVILLTDGVANCGQRSPLDAAKLCKKWGVKVYPIGIGGEGYRRVPTLFGGTRLIPVAGQFDEATLKEIARITGGKYFTAGRGESLRSVARSIDALERTKIETSTSMTYAERYWWFAFAALALLFGECFLKTTVLLKAP